MVDQLDSESISHDFALPPGAKLFEFEIGSVLGYTRFGVTYRATDRLPREPFAIKEYLPNEFAVRLPQGAVRANSDEKQEEFKAGFEALEEARIMALFGDDHIVRVRRSFENKLTPNVSANCGKSGAIIFRNHHNADKRSCDVLLGIHTFRVFTFPGNHTFSGNHARAAPLGRVHCCEKRRQLQWRRHNFRVSNANGSGRKALSDTKIYQIPRSVMWVRAECVGSESQSI